MFLRYVGTLESLSGVGSPCNGGADDSLHVLIWRCVLSVLARFPLHKVKQMLIEFRVKNFRSLRDEQVLSMVASSDKTM